MKFFSKNEILGILVILAVLVLVSLNNFKVSLRRARDSQRKDDLGSLQNALARYNDDFGSFPLSSPEGKILACAPVSRRGKTVNFSPCDWGKDGLTDLSDPNFPAYLKVLPIDPQSVSGLTYVYLSDGKRFQIYASLEGADENEYNLKILARSMPCGARLCNFGKASGDTPLDKSIEEYENEINAK